LRGLKFRRQHPIDCFIVDFYCARARLVVEIDGHSHASQVEYDDLRTAHLEELGYTVIRFSNEQVHRHPDAVLDEIAQAVDNLMP
jgi:very-short-patch-repair endonuclease